MNEFARVDSIEVLQELRVALCRFADRIKVAVEEAEAEINRTAAWLAQDQRPYWKRQAERRRELLTRARLDLMHKQNFQTALGHKPSFVDEKKAVARARSRVEEAEQKLENVRLWMRRLEQEAFVFKGVVQGLLQGVEMDVPNALAQLDNMMQALQNYTSLPVADALRRVLPPAPVRSAAGESDGDELLSACREQTPSRSLRDDPRWPRVEVDWPVVEGLSERQRDQIAALPGRRSACHSQDRVLLAANCWTAEVLFLERIHPGPGDSGWYLGFADGTDPEEHAVLSVDDLLARRPSWQVLLDLPAGTLVLLRAGAPEKIVDSDGRVQWSGDGA